MNPAGDSDQAAERVDVEAAATGLGDREDCEGDDVSPPVIDLTDPAQAPRRFYANLADL